MVTLRDERGRNVPEGEAGELCVENPYVRGYINRPEAVSAIQNVMPVMGLITGISLLFTAGAAIITAKALGRWDFDEASRSMTTAISSCLGIGLLASLLSGLLAPGISSLLCQDMSLYDNTRKYLLE